MFHSIAQRNCHQREKVEGSGNKTAASLRTFVVLAVSARALKSLVPFLGIPELVRYKIALPLLAKSTLDFLETRPQGILSTKILRR
jgi:hypothetical protein